jgi:hypothetical protein
MIPPHKDGLFVHQIQGAALRPPAPSLPDCPDSQRFYGRASARPYASRLGWIRVDVPRTG